MTDLAVTDASEGVSVEAVRLIPSSEVRRVCGDISDMTLYRYLRRPELQFPQPVYIASRRFWREAEVIAWIRSRGEAAA